MSANVWRVTGRVKGGRAEAFRFIRCQGKAGAKITAGREIDGPFTATLMGDVPVDATELYGAPIITAEFEDRLPLSELQKTWRGEKRA